MKINKVIATVLVTIITICIFAADMPLILAQGNAITISNKEDWIQFSKNCTLDTWSEGKTVSLSCDIDMEGEEFLPVPIFGGTFDGNGYTISGINFSKDGSYIGLFRYVQPNAKITNLNVKADFMPGGSKSFVGGIVGENSGIIEQCSFEGNINGENVIGGIAGMNTNNGRIISCVSLGNISGENFTGGIAGKNEGFLIDCTNGAAINTTYEEKENKLENMDTDIGSVMENNGEEREENEEESILGHSDTGGITGYTSGVVQGCINNGSIGYQHIGYNVGGIAGRQSGYMLGCENHGLIQGRKDVGGIIGQAEPYILLNTSERTMKDIKTEIDKLHNTISSFINDTDAFGNEIDQNLIRITQYSKKAQDNMKVLMDKGIDFVDDNISEINVQAAILSNTINKCIPVFEDIENSGKELSESLEQVVAVLDNIEVYAPDLINEINEISAAIYDISTAQKSFEKAAARANRAFADLEQAIEFDNSSEVKNAVSELSDAIKDSIEAKRSTQTALENIQSVIEEKPESFESIGIGAKEIADSIKSIKENLEVSISSLQTIIESMDTIVLNTEIDFSEFKSAAQKMESAVGYLGDALYTITSNIQDLSTAVEDASYKIDDYTNDISERINSTKSELADSIAVLSYAVDDMKAAIIELKNIASYLSNEEKPEFVRLGNDFANASEAVFNSISDLSGGIDEFRNTISDNKEESSKKLTEISEQIDYIMNLMIGEIDEIQDEGNNSEIFLDVSDENIENTKQGKIAECLNYGSVDADRNTGGIAGAMAIEYTSDPEDEIEKPDTLHFTYQTKAILQDCINSGKITGKKDCSGGVVGLAELGTVYECENYGDVESSNGDYVGGVAGRSESTIRKSYAKNNVSGQRYVGGIAGKAKKITASYTIVNIQSDENAGAICGYIDTIENMSQNYFIDNGIGAVDGISYTGKAEPISFDIIAQHSQIPKKFISFTVTFLADDNVVEIQEIEYGYETSRIKYPDIPPKDGYYGVWEKPDQKNINGNLEIICSYNPYITTLASNEKNDNGKLSLALAEGKFTDKAQLHITESVHQVPEFVNGEAKVYDIVLSNTDIQQDDSVTLRILNEDKDKISAWYLNGSEWKEVNTNERGKYVTLQTTGTSQTICLQYEDSDRGYFVWIIIVFAVGGIVLFFILKRKKKRKLKINIK